MRNPVRERPSINLVRDRVGARRDVTRVISFTSGKGGVGKSSSVINIALGLAGLGRSVLILDADFGLANINVLLGLRPEHTLHDVLAGRKSLEDIILDGPDGISVIPASSGVESMCSLSSEQRLLIMQEVERVGGTYDYLLIDTQAGIGADVLHFNSAAEEVFCIINDEPTSLTDAYALIKVLSQNYGEKSLSIIANSVPDEGAGRRAYQRLSGAVEQFLHIGLKYSGWIPRDRSVGEAVAEQKAVSQLYPSSAAALAYAACARRIDSEYFDYRIKGGMQFFFKQLMEARAHGF